MSEMYKNIYEIDRMIIHQKFDNVREFLITSKTFSTKIFGHLKILVHLVNNLVESEDHLELIEQLIKIPELRNAPLEASSADTRNKTTRSPEKGNGFERVFESFLKENQ